MLGDTSNISQPFPTAPQVFLNPGTPTVTVDSLPSDTLLGGAAAVNQTSAGGVAGFSAVGGANFFFATNPAFASYTLGFIDPTSGPGIPSSTTFNTGSGGTFTLMSTTGDATFSAVPLPAVLPLFASGIGGLSLIDWRRKRRARAAANKNRLEA